MSNMSDLPASMRLRVELGEEPPGQFLIHGITARGRPFRPSDWTERLCGVLAPYRPGLTGEEGPPIDFSPYARPVIVDGDKCVRIDSRLRDIEPVALTFVLNFARDNELLTTRLEAAQTGSAMLESARLETTQLEATQLKTNLTRGHGAAAATADSAWTSNG